MLLSLKTNHQRVLRTPTFNGNKLKRKAGQFLSDLALRGSVQIECLLHFPFVFYLYFVCMVI